VTEEVFSTGPVEKPNTALMTFIVNESAALPNWQAPVSGGGSAEGYPRWRYFDLDAYGQMVFPTITDGVASRIVGVTSQDQLTGLSMPCHLMGQGIKLVEAGGEISCGESVGSDNVGRAVGGHTGGGVALQAASGAGLIIPVLLIAQALS